MDFKSVHFECRMMLFYEISEKSRLFFHRVQKKFYGIYYIYVKYSISYISILSVSIKINISYIFRSLKLNYEVKNYLDLITCLVIAIQSSDNGQNISLQ